MNRIKQLRQEKKLNQLKLAMDLNTTQASISKYELNKSLPDIHMIIKMSEYFHVSTDYLLGLTPYRQSTAISSLSDQEFRLLNYYNNLTPYQKQQALAYLKGLSD